MDELVRVAAVAGGLLAALGVAGMLGRWRVPGGLLVGLAAVGVGLAGGVLLLADGLDLPALVGLEAEVLRLLAWAAFGGLAAAAGGVVLPGPPVLGAALSGALLGELGAAAALAGAARDRRGAARLTLAAMGGALLGRLGDPAVVALGDRIEGGPLALAPLGVLMALVAWPTREHVVPGRGSAAVTGVALVLGLAVLARPADRTLLLVLGCVLMGGLAAGRLSRTGRRGEVLGQALGPLLWTVGSVLVVLVVTAAGLPELAALGVEELRERLLPWLGPLAAAAGALLAALLDGPAAGLLGAATLDRALSLRAPGVELALAAGLCAGGLGPLVVAGAVRAGLARWLLQVLLAVAWGAWLLR